MKKFGKGFYFFVIIVFAFFFVSTKSPFFVVSFGETKWPCQVGTDYKFKCSTAISASPEVKDCSPLLEYDEDWRWAGEEYASCAVGMGNFTACCYNPKERCNTQLYQCVSNCSGLGRYPVDGQRCLVDGLKCCDISNDDNCICRTHYGGECHDESPGDGWKAWGGPWNNPCENCIGGDTCWVYDPDPICGYIGQRCCGNHEIPDLPEGGCFEGVPYTNNMSQCVCKVDDSKPYKGPIYNGPIIESLEEILNPAVRILYYGGLFVGIFFIILSGYKLMTSEGDPQRTREAQEQLTSAIIGIIFILLSTTIIRIIMKEVIGI